MNNFIYGFLVGGFIVGSSWYLDDQQNKQMQTKARIEKKLDDLGKTRYGISEKQLIHFIDTHSNYPCHLYKVDDRGKHYKCREP